jgi:hypothetical protein
MSDRPSEQEIARIARRERVKQDTSYALTLDHMQREANRKPSPEVVAANREAAAQSAERERRRQELLELDRLEAEEEERRRQERIEQELAPVKESEWKKFQSEFPQLSRSEFERKRWPYVREQLTSREARIEAEIQRLKASGKYGSF